MFSFFLSPILAMSLGSSIMQADSLEKIQEVHMKSNQSARLYYLCKKQMKKKQIPEACYQLSHLEKPIDSEWLHFLDEKCLELTFKRRHLKNLLKSLKNLHISLKCQEYLLKQSQILKLQLRDAFVNEVLDIYIEKSL